MMMRVVMKTPLEGLPDEKAEEVVKVVEVRAKKEEEETNSTVLVEVVGAEEEEEAKVEVQGVAPSLELSCLAGQSPALRLDLLGR